MRFWRKTTSDPIDIAEPVWYNSSIIQTKERTTTMAIPRTLKPISRETAERTINAHMRNNDGHWEGAPMLSDFVYQSRGCYWLIRPPCGSFGEWETGKVSM